MKNTNLNKLIIPESITRVESNAFKNTKLEEIVIPGTVKYLGDRLFQKCILLKKSNYSFANYLLSESLFNGCESLEEVTLPSSIIENSKSV